MEVKELLKPLPISPQPIIDLEYQFLLYQTVVAACSINLFQKLQGGKGFWQLAQENGWQEKTLFYLLESLLYAGYLEKREEDYRISPLAQAYLLQDSDLNMGNWFRDEFTEQSLTKKILQSLEGKQEKSFRKQPLWNPQMLKQVGIYFLTGNLRNSLAACNFAGQEKILDLGGGHGFYSIALAQKYEGVEITILDLPEVTPLTKENIIKFALAERINVVNGDFLQEEIGWGYDVVFCFNIINGEENSGQILSRVWRALKPGGRVMVKCRVEDGEENLAAVLNRLYWQVQGGGELFSCQKWLDILAYWGFQDNCLLQLDGTFAVFQGIKKEGGKNNVELP